MTEITAERSSERASRALAGSGGSTRRRRARLQLVVDPCVRPLQANGERGARLPRQLLLDQRIVRVASADAFWSVEVVVPPQPHAGDLLDGVDELVDRDELTRADVDRLSDVA